MERATQRDELGYYLVGDAIYGDCGVPEKFRGDDVDRLAAYEDTGLEPEEIISAIDMAKIACALHELNTYKELGSIDRLRELAQADKEGRCVVLPCKIGSPVYSHARRLDGTDYVKETEFWWSDIPQMSKTVFLTRKEAEDALRREQAGQIKP